MAESKLKKALIVLPLALVTIVFPLAAVYMSRAGLMDYKARKAQMRYLGDSIKLQNIPLQDTAGEAYSLSKYEGRVLLLNFYQDGAAENEKVWSEMLRVQTEYSKKTTQRLRLLSLPVGSDSLKSLQQFWAKNELPDRNWQSLKGRPDQVLNLAVENCKLGQDTLGQTLVLFSMDQTVAMHYNALKPEKINRMVEDIALLLPAKKDRKKLRYQEEKELYQ
ncbi:AhpC/TSA family protein [Saprospira grandis DSM 2844]|uniref:AhpC/TSA family protein n=1 Tax=Saprospira grandis DSM 2844 TaxID=694433 RepID=J0P9T8_9BACT|nr:redoxin domain-containing protein [Saprospira grandis]EJF54367.1 AhpC/TSA family protein [Saprospira grandis DSM 2844]